MKKHTYSAYHEVCEAARCSYERYPYRADEWLQERHERFAGAIDIKHIAELREADVARARDAAATASRWRITSTGVKKRS